MHASLNVGYQGKSGPGKIHEVILVVSYCALMKHQAFFTIQAKLKLAIKLIIIFFTFRS